MNAKSEDQAGFTIIEVVLVLGIAGLIFLMFLIALPALQALQRDSAREENISKLIEKIKKYQTNSRGALPSDWDKTGGFYKDYVGENFVDPGGDPYVFRSEHCGGMVADGECGNSSVKGYIERLNGKEVENEEVYIVTQARCADDERSGVVASSNVRKFAVLQRLERGGVYCEDA